MVDEVTLTRLKSLICAVGTSDSWAEAVPDGTGRTVGTTDGLCLGVQRDFFL
jgi:hypothetical protein